MKQYLESQKDRLLDRLRHRQLIPALRITLVYVVISALWIMFSDRAVEAIATGGISERDLQTAKGLFFVTASGLLIFVLLLRELTSRIRAEAAEAVHRQLYAATFEQTTVGMVHATADGRILEVNGSLCRFLGRPREEIVGRHFSDMTASEHQETDAAGIETLLNGESDSYTVEKPYLRGDGETVWGHLTLTLIRPDEDEPPLLFGVIEDIQAHKVAQERALETGRLLQRTFDSISEVVLVVDGNTRTIVQCNAAARDVLGYEPEQLIGEPTRIVHADEESYRRFGEKSTAVLEAGKTFTTEWRMRRSDGQLIDTLHTVNWLDRDARLVVSVTRDITARKRAREELKRQRRFAATLLQSMAEGVVACDTEGRVVLQNRRAREWKGLPIATPQPGEQLFEDPAVISGPEGEPLRRALAGERIRGEELKFEGQQAEIMVQCNADPIETDEGDVLGAVAVMHDVTELRSHEQALGESEERYRQLLDLSPNEILVQRKGRIIYANQAARELIGMGPEDRLLGRDVIDFLHPGDQQVVAELLKRLDTDHPVLEPTVRRLIRLDGSEAQIEMRAARMQFRGETLTQIVLRDVTDERRQRQRIEDYSARLKELTNRLLRIQEEERRLIASELHDEFGQLVTAMSLHLASFKGDQLPEPVRERCEALLAICRRLGNQVRNLTLNLRPSSLDEFGLWRATEELIERIQAASGLKLHAALSGDPMGLPDDVSISAYRVIQEALHNVMKHAKASEAFVEAVIDAEAISVEVRDDGRGFDPRRVQGGIGLSGMRERVELLDGVFAIESRPQEGTTVRAEIPLRRVSPLELSQGARTDIE